ncbi:MAG: hypothetical protein ABSF65_07905 [Candidatus Bathyarchaeia archaeon]
MEYQKTRDILHVKEILGHKSLNNTMLYTQFINSTMMNSLQLSLIQKKYANL